MKNDEILTETYRDKIMLILNKLTTAKPDFEFVDSAYQRARELQKRGVREDDVAFYDPEKHLIVIQKRISQEKKNSILDGIDYVVSFVGIKPSMSSPAARILDNDEKFVIHTVHHEIGHSIGIKVESEADIYAFEQMGTKAVLRIRI